MVLPIAYLPSIGWWQRWRKGAGDSHAGDVAIEVWESFPKQTLRNRCRIAGPNGVQTLSVPVQKCEHKQLTKDVRISYQMNWQRQHWQALRSAYRQTPFFDYYADFFRPHYERRYEFLLDLNEALIGTIEGLMGGNAQWRTTADWRGEEIEGGFALVGEPREYYQIFADRCGFQANLSIVDLLFNMGTESVLYLEGEK